MDKKQLPNDSEGLEAVIRKAEAEMETVSKWMERESSGTTRPTSSARSAKEQSPRSGNFGPDSGPEILSVLTGMSREVVVGGITTRRQLWIGIIGLFVAILGLIVAVVFGIITNNKSAQRAENRYAQSQLNITFPLQGANVGLGQKVRGTSPYPGRNHYLLITTVRTGKVRVEPVVMTPDGSFSADARFGGDGNDQAAGEDDEFTLRVLVTESRMESGALAALPTDAILSEPVTVRRSKLTPQINISAPADGSDVGSVTSVSGKSSVPDLNHYIVVKSVKVGTSYVQDRLASINRADGAFSGNARIGAVAVGIGEQFEIRVIATKLTLPAAPLTNEPADAISSNSVTVTRKQ